MALQARTETKTTKRPATRTRDAVGLLMADHRSLKRLFDAYKKLLKGRANRSTKSEKANLVQQICIEFTVHSKIEEEIFYPAARKAIKDNELMDMAEVEHASALDLVGQLSEMDPGDELYDAKVIVLSEFIELHVGEEEKQMFPKVKKTRLDLDSLGDKLKERKLALTEKIKSRPKRH